MYRVPEKKALYLPEGKKDTYDSSLPLLATRNARKFELDRASTYSSPMDQVLPCLVTW
jgi:hypothetical protein